MEKKIMTYEEMKNSNYRGHYKVYEISVEDAYLSWGNVFENVIFECSKGNQIEDIVVGGELIHKGEEINAVYFYSSTLVELI